MAHNFPHIPSQGRGQEAIGHAMNPYPQPPYPMPHPPPSAYPYPFPFYGYMPPPSAVPHPPLNLLPRSHTPSFSPPFQAQGAPRTRQASLARERPNREIKPGGTKHLFDILLFYLILCYLVFRLDVHYIRPESKITQPFDTDEPFNSFFRKACANLEVSEDLVQLGYKFTSDPRRSPPTVLSTSGDYHHLIQAINTLARQARSRAVELEVRDIVRHSSMIQSHSGTNHVVLL